MTKIGCTVLEENYLCHAIKLFYLKANTSDVSLSTLISKEWWCNNKKVIIFFCILYQKKR